MIVLSLAEWLPEVAMLRLYRRIFLFVILNGVIVTKSFFNEETYTLPLFVTLLRLSPLAATTRLASLLFL